MHLCAEQKLLAVEIAGDTVLIIVKRGEKRETGSETAVRKQSCRPNGRRMGGSTAWAGQRSTIVMEGSSRSNREGSAPGTMAASCTAAGREAFAGRRDKQRTGERGGE